MPTMHQITFGAGLRADPLGELMRSPNRKQYLGMHWPWRQKVKGQILTLTPDVGLHVDTTAHFSSLD